MALFEAVDNLLLNIGNEKIVTIFYTNFYKLYDEIKKDEDVLTPNLIKQWLWTKNDHSLDKYSTDDFTEIYLFFDYDLHAAISFLDLTTDEANKRVQEMLQLFDNEYEHGKLFVSYPMIESYLYTKKMPDDDFAAYTYKIADLAKFKECANVFSDYTQDQFTTARTKLDNWRKAIFQNVAKANYLCMRQYAIPQSKDDVEQLTVYESEVNNYVIPNAEVAILCAFPLFVYYYLKPELFMERILSRIK